MVSTGKTAYALAAFQHQETIERESMAATSTTRNKHDIPILIGIAATHHDRKGSLLLLALEALNQGRPIDALIILDDLMPALDEEFQKELNPTKEFTLSIELPEEKHTYFKSHKKPKYSTCGCRRWEECKLCKIS